MTENPNNVVEINGKRICWNYRKGKCKFGHKCKFAHDSDIDNSNVPKDKVPNESISSSESGLSSLYNYAADPFLDQEEENQSKRKSKAGLSEGLIPNKKAKKLYGIQQAKEQPWLVKR